MLDEQVYMTGEYSSPHFEVLQSAPQVLHCENLIPLQAVVAKTEKKLRYRYNKQI